MFKQKKQRKTSCKNMQQKQIKTTKKNKAMRTIEQQIRDFLKDLNSDLLDYIDIDKIDDNNPFDSIFEMIDEAGGFDIDIIYSNDAINYLKENDPSLKESLELATEAGFFIDDLNSVILANLLAHKKASNEFLEYREKINSFFENL